MHPLIDLAANVGKALAFVTPRYVYSVVGGWRSWLAHYTPGTEFRRAYPSELPGNLITGVRLGVPAWPGRPPWVPDALPGREWLFRESLPILYPLESPPADDARESWMLINGICTDEEILQLNAECVHGMFGQPLTLLHNQTHGAWLDLFECALGKGWMSSTEAVRKLFPALYAELKSPDVDRVVLLAHSQGTIVAAVFLALLRRLIVDGTPPIESIEDKQARELLSRSIDKPRARVLQIRRGLAGASFVKLPLSNGELLSDDANLADLYDGVAYWLDWTANECLGLPPLMESELRKLEIYCFATCATDMRYIEEGESPAPYMEHFGNERDLVARLGMFADQEGLGSTRIDGAKFARKGAYGHLLNAHYLQDLRRQWEGGPEVYVPMSSEHSTSRLQRSFRRRPAERLN